MADQRDRMEARAPMPITRGRCDWCGAQVPRGRVYCGSDCRKKYDALLMRQGKPIMQLLKLWRRHRGAAGTRGAGKLSLIAARVDAALAEDRARIQRFNEERQ